MIREKKIVIGICLPRNLKETIDKTRGDVPRSTYISKLLEQVHQKKNESKIEEIEDKRWSKSRCQPRLNSATDSSSYQQTPTIDSD